MPESDWAVSARPPALAPRGSWRNTDHVGASAQLGYWTIGSKSETQEQLPHRPRRRQKRQKCRVKRNMSLRPGKKSASLQGAHGKVVSTIDSADPLADVAGPLPAKDDRIYVDNSNLAELQSTCNDAVERVCDALQHSCFCCDIATLHRPRTVPTTTRF